MMISLDSDFYIRGLRGRSRQFVVPSRPVMLVHALLASVRHRPPNEMPYAHLIYLSF